jgi:predicted SnoaL-like aldol condensation-catalyzing enzyme
MHPALKPALGLALIAGLAAMPRAAGAEPPATAQSAAAAARETARNRAIVTDFAHRFYTLRQVRAAFEAHVAPDYIQHNPGLADGREAAIAALAPMFSDPGHSFAIRHIVVDGDLAAIHLFVKPDPAARGAAVADFYRLRHGRIVEHWDVIQPIPDKAANDHPMF